MSIRASGFLKVLYCLALLLSVIPAPFLGESGWVGLATGRGILAGGMLSSLAMFIAFIYRIFLVIKFKNTLSAVYVKSITALIRKLGIFLMILGVFGALSICFTRIIALGIFGHPGQGGIAYFAVGVYAHLISSLGLPGVIIFEASRLFGFEQSLRENPEN